MSLEGIQIWSLLFSAGLIIITDKIFEKLKINNHWRYLGDLIIASHPSLIIFSGSINNDCLLVFLQALIILELIIWYRDSSYKNIIILAITTGLCVMTKANGAIMAIPILYVFIKKFIILYKDKKISKKFFYQMGLFLIISLPIGLWFQVRNMILFDTVKIPTPNERLSLREIPLIKRLLGFNIMNLFRFVDFESDYNIFILILKTTVFGEFSYNDMLFIIPMLLVTNILLIIIGLFYIITYIFKKKNFIINILFITWITSLIMEIIFNIKYPYICTANFRYIVISLLPGIIMPIFMLKDKEDSLICDVFATLSIALVMTSAIFIILM